MRCIAVFLTIALLFKNGRAASQLAFRPEADSNQAKISIRVLPQNFYTKQLGFACKKEVQLQKITRIPLFFRLGSKDYVDYLEQKPNAIKRF